jgi:hypothetical protein
MRRNPQGANALLHGILTSDQGHVSVLPQARGEKYTYDYQCHKGLQQEGYALKTRLSLTKAEQWWALPSHELDRIVFDRLCDLAERDHDLADRVRAVFESLKGQEMDESTLLTNQIKQTQDRITRLDFLLTTPGIPLDEATATKYAIELAELNQQLPRLLKKQQAQPAIDPGETIANFYFVLSHLPTEFQKQNIDVQKQMMSKLIKQVTVNNISPHLFRLYIVWQDGIATRPDVALLWRGVGRKDLKGWREEEDAIIHTLYPRSSQLELMRALPLRSWTIIRERAAVLRVPRDVAWSGRKKVNAYHATVSHADLEAATHYAENGEDEAYMRARVNGLAENTAKGEINAYWPLPVEIVGFSDFISNRGSRPRPEQQ